MNRIKISRALLSLALALAAGAVHACRVAPAAQLIGIDEQLSKATTVALGQAIGATSLDNGMVEYRFLVLEQLAGPAQKVLTVMGRPGGDRQESSFDNHQDPAFWTRGGGRMVNGTDCVIRPSFVVGDTYLLVLGPTPTRRSFEKIEMAGGSVNQDDQWLRYVKARFAGPAAQHEGAAEYERVGRFIYAFHRIVARQDLDRLPLAVQGAPEGLMLRAGRLAEDFDGIVQNHARTPDAQFDATLREAAAFQAALQAWRASTVH
jgi:hypothetical protein